MWATHPAQQLQAMVIWRADVVSLGRGLTTRPMLVWQHTPCTHRVALKDELAQTPPPRRQGRLAPGTGTHELSR